LQHGGTDVVFGVEPRERDVRVERGLPSERAVWLEFHAEKGIRQTGEVVIVYPSIQKRRFGEERR
jgi:hypothetical protein